MLTGINEALLKQHYMQSFCNLKSFNVLLLLMKWLYSKVIIQGKETDGEIIKSIEY